MLTYYILVVANPGKAGEMLTTERKGGKFKFE